MLENLIKDLTEAIIENTKAIKGMEGATSAKSNDEEQKNVKDKSKSTSKTKAGGKGKGKAGGGKGKGKKEVTVDSLKAQAKKIAVASEDPTDCMGKIRELVTETAIVCYKDSSLSLDDFDADGLKAFKKELDDFTYTEEEDDDASVDDMEI